MIPFHNKNASTELWDYDWSKRMNEELKDKIINLVSENKKISFTSIYWHQSLINIPVSTIKEVISTLIDENKLEEFYDEKRIVHYKLGAAK